MQMHEDEKQSRLPDEERYQKLFGLNILLTPVFVISSIAIVVFVLGSLIFQEHATTLFKHTRSWLTTNLDWFFMLSVNLVVLFCLVVAFSPLGKVRLGGKDAKPEYSYLTWLAMLFAAGVGIGLLFFGVLEPVTYFQSPPLGVEKIYDTDTAYTAENTPDIDAAATQKVAALAIATTTFHWGLHGWAVYAIVGLALAFFAYNKGLPLTIRSAFYPIFGERIWGWPGHIIDTFAIFAGLFGLATSLGFGAQQVTAGLNYLFGVPQNIWTMVGLILFITTIAMISVLSGINVGIKRLSQFNIILAFVLLGVVMILGPTGYIFRSLFAGLKEYAVQVLPLSNWVGRPDKAFMHGWTTFYWAWWIAWAPFVGSFIARVSKGRTVREFMFFVLILPTLLCLLWFSVFGGTSIHEFLTSGYTGVTETVEAYKPELVLFKMFDVLPLTMLLSCAGMTLTIIFFVTSSDSGSLIIDTIASGGRVDAPAAQRVFWAWAEGLVAIVLLVGGGLTALQAASLSTGLPFALVLLGMCVCVWIGLRRERAEEKED